MHCLCHLQKVGIPIHLSSDNPSCQMHCSLWNMICSGWSDGEDYRYPLKLFTQCQDFLSQEWEGWCIARKELALRNNLCRAEALQDRGGICGQELIGLSTEIFPKKSSGVSSLCLRKQKDAVACANTPHSLSPAMLSLHADYSCLGEEQNHQEIKDQALCESIWHSHPMKARYCVENPVDKTLVNKEVFRDPDLKCKAGGNLRLRLRSNTRQARANVFPETSVLSLFCFHH